MTEQGWLLDEFIAEFEGRSIFQYEMSLKGEYLYSYIPEFKNRPED